MSTCSEPDQARRYVGPDLSPNCLPRLSADDTTRQRVKRIVFLIVIVYQFKETAGDSLASQLHQLTNRLDAIASNQQAHMHRPPKSNTREDFFGEQESHKREYNSKLPSRDIRSANELDSDMLEAMSSDIKTILESVKETNEIVNTIRKDQMAVILKESGKENVEESSTTTKPPETATTLEPEHENNGNCKIIRPQSCLELLNAGCNQSGVYSVYPTKGEKDLVEVIG